MQCWIVILTKYRNRLNAAPDIMIINLSSIKPKLIFKICADNLIRGKGTVHINKTLHS